MKTKTGISLMMALLIVVSTLAAGAVKTTNVDKETLESTYDFGVVDKEVYDGEGWVEEYTAELDEIVQFRINFTYQKTDHENASQVINIVANDTLPDCLEYHSAYPEPTSTDGVITWVYEPGYNGTVLYDNESLTILLNATVVDYTDEYGEENFFEVNALEKCSSRPLYQNDTATVICLDPEPPEKDIHIHVKRIGFGRICAEIENEGETNLTDVDYKISMAGGLLGRVNVSHNCTIEELGAGATQKVCTGKMFGANSVKLLSFGRVSGSVEVTIDEETYTKEFSGRVLGKLVLITKQSIPEE